MPEGRHTHTRSHRRYRELAFRESDRISVRLYWDSLENEVFVSVARLAPVAFDRRAF